MVSSDKDTGIDNIVGIVAASARVETLKKID
jgi:hypothetical protein